MNEQEIRVVEAAFLVFSRYGVKRTSMGDIAEASSISRQTLYKVFSNKEEILQATIRLFSDRAIQEIESGLESADGLEEQIDVVFNHMALKPFELLRATPNFEDIIIGFNESSIKEIAASDEKFRIIIERLLVNHQVQLDSAGLISSELADVIQISVSAAKSKATNLKHLKRLLKSLKFWIMSTAIKQ